MDDIHVRESSKEILVVDVERHNQMSNLGSSERQSGLIPSASVMLRDMEGHDSGYDDACRSQQVLRISEHTARNRLSLRLTTLT